MYIKEKIEFGGRELTVESGKIAKQASGSCIITYGETVLFVAVTSSKGIEEDRGIICTRSPGKSRYQDYAA